MSMLNYMLVLILIAIKFKGFWLYWLPMHCCQEFWQNDQQDCRNIYIPIPLSWIALDTDCGSCVPNNGE